MDVLVNIFVPIIGIALATRRPNNPIGWMFFLAGFFLGVGSFTQQYAIRGLSLNPIPADSVYGVAWVANWSWSIPVGVLPFLFLLFPDGRLPSKRWRWVAWFDVAVVCVLTLGGMILSAICGHPGLRRSGRHHRRGQLGRERHVRCQLLLILVALPAVLRGPRGAVPSFTRRGAAPTQVVRHRGRVRRGIVRGDRHLPRRGAPLDPLAALPLRIDRDRGVEVPALRHRCRDREGRGVRGAGGVHHDRLHRASRRRRHASRQRCSPLLSAVAAAVVAVAFQPVRERARRLANRVVYGKRATPYEVLAGSPSARARPIPPTTCCRAWSVCWPRGSAPSVRPCGWPWDRSSGPRRPRPMPRQRRRVLRRSGSGQDLPASPDREQAFPVRHGGELLGAISVVTPATETAGTRS